MKTRKIVFTIVALTILAGAWALFRPERLVVNARVNESFPQSSTAGKTSSTLAVGTFHSVLHNGKGTATIYQLKDGKRVLRLTDFETSNGPDLWLYLIAAGDASDSATVKQAGFISLGPLKGNQGDQNYDLPSEVDLAKYRAVTVWCRRFAVNFATAPLSALSGGNAPVAMVGGH